MVVFRRTSRWSRAASASMTDLVLDPAIRDWVLVPIVIIMFLMGLLRNNVMKLIKRETAPNLKQVTTAKTHNKTPSLSLAPHANGRRCACVCVWVCVW